MSIICGGFTDLKALCPPGLNWRTGAVAMCDVSLSIVCSSFSWHYLVRSSPSSPSEAASPALSVSSSAAAQASSQNGETITQSAPAFRSNGEIRCRKLPQRVFISQELRRRCSKEARIDREWVRESWPGVFPVSYLLIDGWHVNQCYSELLLHSYDSDHTQLPTLALSFYFNFRSQS